MSCHLKSIAEKTAHRSNQRPSYVVKHFFQRLSVILQRANSALIASRAPPPPPPHVTGHEWYISIQYLPHSSVLPFVHFSTTSFHDNWCFTDSFPPILLTFENCKRFSRNPRFCTPHLHWKSWQIFKDAFFSLSLTEFRDTLYSKFEIRKNVFSNHWNWKMHESV